MSKFFCSASQQSPSGSQCTTSSSTSSQPTNSTAAAKNVSRSPPASGEDAASCSVSSKTPPSGCQTTSTTSSTSCTSCSRVSNSGTDSNNANTPSQYLSEERTVGTSNKPNAPSSDPLSTGSVTSSGSAGSAPFSKTVRSLPAHKCPHVVVKYGSEPALILPKTECAPGALELLRSKLKAFFKFDNDAQDFVLLDLQKNPVALESLADLPNGSVVLAFKSEDFLGQKEHLTLHEIEVDTTPSTNILIKGGATDYSIAGAIAELVDNAIQAVTKSEDPKTINIVIAYGHASDPVASPKIQAIRVHDTGNGMTYQELHNFLTLGETQADKPGSASDDHFGQISRYGEGAKKAAFFLGKTLCVKTKQKDLGVLFETRLSVRHLETSARQDWRALISIKETEHPDPLGPHYTLITVKHVSISLKREELSNVASTLVQIYFFYLHPEHLPCQTNHSACDILFNKICLRDTSSDLISHLFTQAAEKEPKRFQLPFPPGPPVEMYLFYFPYKDGSETSYLMGSTSEPGDKRKKIQQDSGLMVYFNYRGIPEATIPRLGFMSPGRYKKVKIEEVWLNRVRGIIFLDSRFPVTHNKMHICVNSDPFPEFIQLNPRAVEKDFREWLISSHQNRTTCKGFSKNQVQYNIGTPVVTIAKNSKVPPTTGKITEIFFLGSPDHSQSEIQVKLAVLTWRDEGEQVFEAKKISQAIEDAKYQQYLENQKRRLPSQIKLYMGGTMDLPDEVIEASPTACFSSIAVGLCNGLHKNVEPPIMAAHEVSIHYTVFFKDKEVESNEAQHESYSAGRITFKKVGLSAPLVKAGDYRIEFSCSYSNVPPVIHKFRVIPGPLARTVLSFCHDGVPSEFSLQTPLPPLEISLCDDFDNSITVEESHLATLTIKCVGTSEKEEIPVTVQSSELQDDGSAHLVVELGRSKLASNEHQLELYLGETTPAVIPIHVVPGPIHSLQFQESNIFEKPFPEESVIPGFSIRFADEDGNTFKPAPTRVSSKHKKHHTKGKSKSKSRSEGTSEDENRSQGDETGDMTVTASSQLIEGQSVSVLLSSSGVCMFGDKNSGLLRTKHVERSMSADLTFSLSKNKDEMFSATFTLKVHSLCGASGIALLNEDGNEIAHGKGGDVPVLVRVSAIKCEHHWRASVDADVPKSSQKKVLLGGTIETSWSHDIVNYAYPSLSDLPLFVSEKVCKRYMHKVIFENEKNKKRFPLLLEVEVLPGPPVSFHLKPECQEFHCGSEFKLSIFLHDEASNVVVAHDSLDCNLEEITPNIEVLSSSPDRVIKLSGLSIEPFEGDHFCAKLSIIGLDDVCIIVRDPKGSLHEARKEIKLLPGSFRCLKVNGSKHLSLKKSTSDYIDSLEITSCDAFDNIVPLQGTVIDSTWADPETPPFKFPHGKQMIDGKLKLTNLQVNGKPGEYKLTLTPRNVNAEEAVIKLFLEAGNFPTEIKILEAPDHGKVGQILDVLVVQVLSTTGMALEVPTKELTARFSANNEFPCSAFETGVCSYHFTDLICPPTADTYPLEIVYKSPSVTLTKTITLIAESGTPQHMVLVPQAAVKSSVSLSGSSEDRQLVSDLVVELHDKHGNICSLVGGALDVSVTGLHAPKFQENTQFPIDSGRASIPSLTVDSSRAVPNGTYVMKLQATCNGNALVQEIQFLLSNDIACTPAQSQQAEKMKLRQQLDAINLRISELKAQISPIDTGVTSTVQNTLATIKQGAPRDMDIVVENVDASGLPEIHHKLQQRLQEVTSSARRLPILHQTQIISELASDLAQKGENSGIIGALRELIFVESEKESRAITKFLGPLVDSVIICDNDVAMSYYEKYKNLEEGGNLIVLPPVAMHSSKSLKLPPGCPTTGFIDFAVNRCQLRKKQEHLRDSLLMTLFQTAAIVDTMTNALAMRSVLQKKFKKDLSAYIVVDQCEVLMKGMVPLGAARQEAPSVFGQLPLSELPLFQWLSSSIEQLEALQNKVNEDASKSHSQEQIADLEAEAKLIQSKLDDATDADMADIPPKKPNTPPKKTKRGGKGHSRKT
ncbi:structural maintenance of chromosomes flexible hinge domain-containing protein 1 [Pelomyxa schiedti]|nr:structural maintenance of chromosomes flexible hinge domain-containing protein 1 [Pelomyxa schiedti]